MQHGDTVFFPMTEYWMGRLTDGRRVEVRAKTAHWTRLIPGRRYARFQVGNFRGQQLLFMIAAVETVSRLTLLELAEPELRTFLRPFIVIYGISGLFFHEPPESLGT